MSLNTVIKTTRPSFLILSPVCVLLGLSTALATGSAINLNLFYLIVAAAILAHVSVNILNEYYDFKSGLDLKTSKTAFSGGSGALPENPGMAKTVLISGLVSLLLTIMTGLYLAIERGPQVLPVGIAGVVIIITYTQWLNRFPLLCLVAPGLGFGILMVVGTHVILTGEYSLLAWLVSLIPFFLANNLLLLNQYPDIEADASIGRNTFPIAFGLTKSNALYAIFSLATYSLILFLIINAYLPRLSFIALVPMIFSLTAFLGANKHKSEIGRFPRYMGANVMATILTPLLLSISIIYG